MLENIKSFIPFWNYFHGLPTKHQIGYTLLFAFFILVLIFYTIFCMNIKYQVEFEVRSNSDNKIVNQPVTLILDHVRKRRHFTIQSGKHSDEYFSGEYTLSAKPEKYYQIAEPTKVTVNKFSEEISEPEVIYLNILQPHRNLDDSDTEEIVSSAPKIVQTDSKEITLYTIIKSLQSSGNKPIEGLTFGNFSVLEKYGGTEKEAEIIDLNSLQASSLNIVLIVDVSGSMKSYIGQVQAAINRFIQELKNIGDRDNLSGRISVLLVRGNSMSLGNFLRIPPSGQSIWYQFDDLNLDQLVNNLSQVNPEGNTPLYDGLNLAVQQLMKFDESSYNVIICLSDGDDNRSKKNAESILSVVQKSQVPVFSVAYKNTEEITLKLRQLMEISRVSGAGDENIGSFINTDIDQLGDLFYRIAGSIEKAYELKWRTTGAKIGDDVDVNIKVSYEGRKGLFETEINKSYTLRSLPIQPVR